MSFLVQNALMFGVFVLALMLVGVAQSTTSMAETPLEQEGTPGAGS